VYRLLSTAIATLSVASILYDAFELSFAYALRQVIEYYDMLSHAMLGWMQPYMELISAFITRHTEISIVLGSQWRHVFLLCGIYFIRDSIQFLRIRDYTGAALTLPLAIAMAATSAVIVSSVPLDSASIFENTIAALAPLWALAVYRFVRAFWATYRYCEEVNILYDLLKRIYFSLIDVIIMIFILIHIIILFRLDLLYGSQLIFLAGWILAFAIWQIYKGWERCEFPNLFVRSGFNVFWRHGNTRLGVEIVTIYLSVVFFVVTNAGLQRFGL